MLQPERPLILPMREDDLDAVCAIANASFDTPWSRQTFADELGRSWAHLRVLRESPRGPIVAFVAYWRVRDEVHVLNLATHPVARRCGYARLLMEDTLALARAHQVRYVTLEVRARNRAARTLYESLGFDAIGVRPRYYSDTDEDAVVMMLQL